MKTQIWKPKKETIERCTSTVPNTRTQNYTLYLEQSMRRPKIELLVREKGTGGNYSTLVGYNGIERKWFLKKYFWLLRNKLELCQGTFFKKYKIEKNKREWNIFYRIFYIKLPQYFFCPLYMPEPLLLYWCNSGGILYIYIYIYIEIYIPLHFILFIFSSFAFYSFLILSIPFHSLTNKK